LVLAACGTVGTIEPPQKPKPPSTPIWVGGPVTGSMLVHMVKPAFPPELRRPEAQTVRLNCTIGEDGRVHDVRFVSGPSALAPFALDAVKQWRYEPVFLYSEMDGKRYPISVKTVIDLTFPGR